MPRLDSEFHVRILKYSDRISPSIVNRPRLPASERRRLRIRNAIRSGAEIQPKKNSPSMIAAIAHHQDLKRRHEAELRKIEERLFDVEVTYGDFQVACDSRFSAIDNHDWRRMLDTYQEYKALQAQQATLKSKIDRVAGDLKKLRRIEERDYQDFLRISSRRKAQSAALPQIA